jgi:hypothetical protein
MRLCEENLALAAKSCHGNVRWAAPMESFCFWQPILWNRKLLLHKLIDLIAACYTPLALKAVRRPRETSERTSLEKTSFPLYQCDILHWEGHIKYCLDSVLISYYISAFLFDSILPDEDWGFSSLFFCTTMGGCQYYLQCMITILGI